MRKLAVVTGSRSEWSGLRMFCKLARHSSVFDLAIVASGMHCLPEYGHTYREIEANGFQLADLVYPGGDSQADSLSYMLHRFSGSFWHLLKPDAVMIEGDRVEALSACLAASYLNIPVFHAGGGDITTTIDNSARNAISAFASLHFCSHQAAADRLRQMGVPGEIHVTGGLGIDAIMQTEFPPREQVLADLGLPPGSRYLLVGFHPETGHEDMAGVWMMQLLTAVASTGLHAVLTYPNSDPGSERIIGAIENQVERSKGLSVAFPNLGTRYLTALRHADALVGNSSSGLYEAPSLKVPVVNVGHRQDGRPRAANVLECGYEFGNIRHVVNVALYDDEWRRLLPETHNYYGDGHAAERMMEIIERRI